MDAHLVGVHEDRGRRPRATRRLTRRAGRSGFAPSTRTDAWRHVLLRLSPSQLQVLTLGLEWGMHFAASAAPALVKPRWTRTRAPTPGPTRDTPAGRAAAGRAGSFNSGKNGDSRARAFQGIILLPSTGMSKSWPWGRLGASRPDGGRGSSPVKAGVRAGDGVRPEQTVLTGFFFNSALRTSPVWCCKNCLPVLSCAPLFLFSFCPGDVFDPHSSDWGWHRSDPEPR